MERDERSEADEEMRRGGGDVRQDMDRWKTALIAEHGRQNMSNRLSLRSRFSCLTSTIHYSLSHLWVYPSPTRPRTRFRLVLQSNKGIIYSFLTGLPSVTSPYFGFS